MRDKEVVDWTSRRCDLAPQGNQWQLDPLIHLADRQELWRAIQEVLEPVLAIGLRERHMDQWLAPLWWSAVLNKKGQSVSTGHFGLHHPPGG